MTDKYYALTVALDADVRSDDAQALIAAILMLRGVTGVTPAVVDVGLYTATVRARAKLQQKLLEAFNVD